LISRVVISLASVSIAVTNVATFASFVLFAFKSRLMTQIYPRHLNGAVVIVAVAWIKVAHGFSLSVAHSIAADRDDDSDYGKP
jgi:hypothetical protein